MKNTGCKWSTGQRAICSGCVIYWQDRLGLDQSLSKRIKSTGADPLLGPLVFTSFPSISKPSVGRLPRGRAGLSPTCWQSTDRDTLTWLTDRWTCQSQEKEDWSNRTSDKKKPWNPWLFCHISPPKQSSYYIFKAVCKIQSWKLDLSVNIFHLLLSFSMCVTKEEEPLFLFITYADNLSLSLTDRAQEISWVG